MTCRLLTQSTELILVIICRFSTLTRSHNPFFFFLIETTLNVSLNLKRQQTWERPTQTLFFRKTKN